MKYKLRPHYIESADGILEVPQEDDTPPPTPSPEPEPLSDAEVKREKRKKKLSEAQLRFKKTNERESWKQ